MEGLGTKRAIVQPHEHAVCVYDRPEEIVAALGSFIADGVARPDLVVFVHGFAADEEAWTLIARAAPDVPRESKVVVVGVYRDVFEAGNGRIDRDHVQRVIEGLVESSAREGRGTRIFVDASRVYFASDRGSEWFAFEEWLGRALHARVALVCAYQRSDIMRSDVLANVLRTHAYRFDATE